MPAKVTKGGLSAKLGAAGRKAIEAHRNDETKIDSTGNLPAGIEGGLAKLVDCKFTTIAEGKQNAGQYMFYAAGVVISPKEFQGMRIEGLRTQISEPMFETPTRKRATVDDHFSWVLNTMRALGLDTTDVTLDNVEEQAEVLKAMEPVFRFRTWAGSVATSGPYKDKPAMIQHTWQGVVSVETASDATTASVNGDVQDDTGEDATKSEHEEAGTEGDDENTELDQLSEAAGSDDETEAAEAQNRIREIAESKGLAKEVDDADDWTEAVELLRSGEDEVPFEPTKGDQIYYRPIDAKTKKPVKAKVAVEVLAVNVKAKTVDLQSLSDKKVKYKTVAWDELIQE